MVEKSTTSEKKIRVANAPLSRVLISGPVAGGLAFAIILVIYFTVLFGQRSLVRFGLRPLFKIFPATDGKTYGTKSTMENIHSLYKGRGSSRWAGYEYKGQMMLTDERGGIGIVFLENSRGRENRLYRLKRCGRDSTLALGGYPIEIRGKGERDTEVSPEAGVWYRFKIQVEDAGGRTEIRANVWKEGIVEPAKWQVECFDAGRSRSIRGSVGVWACSEGTKYFDDLLVKPIYAEAKENRPDSSIRSGSLALDSLSAKVNDGSESEERPSGYLFCENFDRFGVGAHPRNWSDGLAPVDFSETADRVSRFFRMNLLDFAGPWDEVVDWATIALTFCLAGWLAGMVLRHRVGIRRSRAAAGWIWRIPFEFLPFLVLFAYGGATKGHVFVLHAAAGVGAGCSWALLNRLVLKLLLSVNGGDSVPSVYPK